MEADMTVEDFATAAYEYGQVFSASVTSWGRTVEHNVAVGGVVNSAHLAWLACDVVYDGARPGPEADQLLRLHGLKRIIEGDHDHLMPVAWPPGGPG